MEEYYKLSENNTQRHHSNGSKRELYSACFSGSNHLYELVKEKTNSGSRGEDINKKTNACFSGSKGDDMEEEEAQQIGEYQDTPLVFLPPPVCQVKIAVKGYNNEKKHTLNQESYSSGAISDEGYFGGRTEDLAPNFSQLEVMDPPPEDVAPSIKSPPSVRKSLQPHCVPVIGNEEEVEILLPVVKPFHAYADFSF